MTQERELDELGREQKGPQQEPVPREAPPAQPNTSPQPRPSAPQETPRTEPALDPDWREPQPQTEPAPPI